MNDRDDSHATRYVKVLAYLLDERLATQSERMDPASVTSSDCSVRLDAKLDAEIAALTWALARLAAANSGTVDGPTWGPNDPRCICRQLEYAVAWEQEKSEVPVFTFDGQLDYGTVLKHDSRCPIRPTPQAEPLTFKCRCDEVYTFRVESGRLVSLTVSESKGVAWLLDRDVHETPSDRGNSASDTHERTTRHDDRGKIQGVDR